MPRTIRATVVTLGLLGSLMAAGCGDSDDGEAGPAPSVTFTEPTTRASTAAMTPAQSSSADETPADETTADETPADETPADETPADETPADETTANETTAPPLACGIDINSAEVNDALTSLPEAFPGAGWIADRATDECNTLAWVQASVEMATGSSPNHVLFFVDRGFVGTATAEPYAYTYVVGETDDTVTVRYRWLQGGDPNANPTGGPADIRYRWDGTRVVMLDPLPPQVTE